MLIIKQLFIYGGLLFGIIAGLAPEAQGQCINTNTLLDSIYSINLRTLTSLGQQADYDEVSTALDSTIRLSRINKGDVYQLIILDKIFSRKSNNPKADSLLKLLEEHYEKTFVTKVKHAESPIYYVALLADQYRNMYLTTLNKDLSLIDFINFHKIDNIILYPISKKPLVYKKVESGISSSYNEQGLIIQEAWTKTTHDVTGTVIDSSRIAKKYRIAASGTITPYEK
ncbi:hypothetical protein GCM10023185_46690 [Hymenobacter saemangeumensis]|uniref:Uncharacterized protein n=1 Tax=Hymenobacter saemangeumensis TaxID=1084522 RepID=A0ABP8ISX7_9BACT